MLKELCTLCGTSGYEDEVIAYIERILTENNIPYNKDKLGNIIAKSGEQPDKLALFAHMDEVAFVVRGITNDGMIKFAPIGGIDEEILPSSAVKINDINGIIGNIPKHLKTKNDDTKLTISDMFIDIGATDKENALNYVNIGDPIYFNSEYVEFGDNLIKSKAVDDRAGVAVILKMLLERNHSFTACFVTREEIGLIGSKMVMNEINPEYAVVLEVTTCADLPDSSYPSTKLGEGVAISVLDGGSVSNQEFNQRILAIAKRKKIKHQLKLTTKGGNDAGTVSYYSGGVKTAVLSLPGRYIHSPVSVISKDDYNAMEKLISNILDEVYVGAAPCHCINKFMQ